MNVNIIDHAPVIRLSKFEALRAHYTDLKNRDEYALTQVCKCAVILDILRYLLF
jgi:hypothetical protein